MKVKTYRQCVICIMDTTDPLITFNEEGVCMYCTDIVPNVMKLHYMDRVKKLAELYLLSEKIKKKGKNKTLDAVMGISGGVDSSYAAYIAHKLGLRVHLITVDNEYDTKIAQENIQKLADYTGYPLKKVKVNFDDYRIVQWAHLDAGVINVEGPTDHFIRTEVINFAKEKKVKFWITGSNYETESIFPKAWGYSNSDDINIKNIIKAYGVDPNDLDLPFMSIWKYKWSLRKIKRIPLLNYVPYNREKAKKVLKEACGWKDYGKKHHENIFTKFYQCYILPKRYNYDKRLSHLSSLIIAGQITKNQALEELEEELYPEEDLKRDMEFINSQLQVDNEFWEEYLNKPDVPHQKFGTNYYHLLASTALFNPLKIPQKVFRLILRKLGV